MNTRELQLQGLGDARLAVHATSALPAWLWSSDGTRVLWTNPVGARLFGAANATDLARKKFGPADPHRRQVAQLAGKLSSSGAVRLERLRGFGAKLGGLMTCGCARLDFPDGGHGVLVAAAEANGRAMPLIERLQRLVEGADAPALAFSREGLFVGASDAARTLFGFRNLAAADLEQARLDALAQGRVEMQIPAGHLVLQRVGSGADTGLVALIAPLVAPQAAPVPDDISQEAQPMKSAPPPVVAPPDYEQPAMSGEAPAEFALIDEFAEPLEAASEAPVVPAAEQCAEPPQPDAATAEVETTDGEAGDGEPSPFVEPVADESVVLPLEMLPKPNYPFYPLPDLPALGEPTRLHPLRFTWKMDADGRFWLDQSEFTHLIGPRTAAGFGRPWRDIAERFALDPEGRVASASATHDTWTGITLNWPVDGGERLPVELSGLPVFDRARKFAGYRGFGVCHDLEGLTRLAALRRFELSMAPPVKRRLSADIVETDSGQISAAELPGEPDVMPPVSPESPAPITSETSPQTDLDKSVEPPKNVLPFRLVGEPRSPALTPVENSAFNELARQLAARLERDDDSASALPTPPIATETVVEPLSDLPEPETPREQPRDEMPNDAPLWLQPPEPPARGDSRRDRALLDLLPSGILIYRLDRLLYANPAFLKRIGYPSLHALEEAGGLDALYVEAGVSQASSTSEAGTPVTISATQPSAEHEQPTEARLFTISWDGDSALALMFTPTQAATAPPLLALPAEPELASPPPAAGDADAEDLAAILDTTAEGIVMFDAEGNIHACNRSAEALFGYDGADFVDRHLTELFAPESQRVVGEYLEGVKGAGVASLLDRGRDVLGRVARGGIVPLAMTMGRTRADGPNFFAVFRDLSQSRKGEGELQQARRLAERAASAKADMLARISHEVRTPLNAIIGFAEVMIAERFGTLGNERYAEYLKDIRASGERVIAIINDLTELSRIETGKLDLAFTNQNLNELVEACVSVMQPQANRERIIIRTSLAQALPSVVADARTLRQITLNLIGTSIHLANSGGQVIVSTAFSDMGEVVLRVRDTGHGLNDNEVAAALEPFRTPPPSDQASDSSGVSLSLTKALVEANRAQFHIKTGGHSGTLIEVVFARALARA
jgi:PAS domain S-box-containing protein